MGILHNLLSFDLYTAKSPASPALAGVCEGVKVFETV